MAETTKIEWTDSTANYWIGCTKDGQGCVFCYAEADWDKRKSRVTWGPRGDRSECKAGPAVIKKFQRAANDNGGVDPELGRRRRIFINSLSDSFDDHQSIMWRPRMFADLEAATHLDIQLLTKRPENVVDMVPAHWLEPGGWPQNIWLGISVPTQKEAREDIPVLRALKRKYGIPVAFLSCEPLLEDLGDIDLSDIDWVIAGGESGRSARSMHLNWVRRLRDQCAAAGVPFLMKQWGEWAPAGQSVTAGHRIHEFGYDEVGQCRLHRVGKKAAGRMLDGVTHTEFPISPLARKAA